VLGIIWISNAKKYTKSISNEGKFTAALLLLARNDSELIIENKIKLRKICSALTILSIAGIFAFDIAVDTFEDIDLLPGFIYSILLTVAICMLSQSSKQRRLAAAIGTVFTASSIVSFVSSIAFFSSYDYIDLTESGVARATYVTYIIASCAEFVFSVFILLISLRVLISFIMNNTGIDKDSDRYSRTELEYHNTLKKYAYIYTGFGILTFLLRLIDIILDYDIKIIFTHLTGLTRPPVAASSVPWLGLIVFISTVIYVGFGFYFCSILKEEVAAKYAYIPSNDDSKIK
jgi:hypothetical protein